MATSRAADVDRGRRVGKYEILTRLSIGGMAELFLAFLPGPGGFKKFVALKQILPDVRADESFVKMFLDEARITAGFTHASIAQVFDLGQEEGTDELYLAMEFVSGQNLEQIVKRAGKREVPIPVGFACRVVRDAALALHYAHHFTDSVGQPMPVVHRDVSPKNLMITYGGQVKMIDFGIAKARGRLNRTTVGIVRGTSGYMSPEQVRSEALDGRSDLFSVAVILHEMLAGERLFSAPTDAGMMLKIVEGEVASPAEANPAVGPDLAAVVLKGLAKEREERFATGKELARALERACPELYDDEQLAEVMAQLFEDKIALTRSIMEMASADRADGASLTRAVEGLTSEEQDTTPRRGRPGPGEKDPSATPGQRAGLATPRPAATPRSRSRSSQRLPRVSSRQGVPPVAEDEVTGRSKVPGGEAAAEGNETLPPRGSPRRSGGRLQPVTRGDVTDARPAPGKGGGALAVVGVLAALAALGALAWALTAGPLSDRAKELVIEEEPPADTGTRPIMLGEGQGPDSDKPAWLRDKEAHEAAVAAERARQAEIEAAAADPERQRLLQDIQAQLAQLDALEAEQRQLKLDARQGKTATEANSNKIDDLQKQIDELKGALQAKQARARPAQVQVVRDTTSARKAEVGYVTIRTVNPGSTTVFDVNGELGSTPLVKLPLEVGVHQLRVVDGDGKVRVLSATIEAGKTLQLIGVDVGSLPLLP